MPRVQLTLSSLHRATPSGGSSTMVMGILGRAETRNGFPQLFNSGSIRVVYNDIGARGDRP